jgi:hypothetical protein
VGSTTLSLSLDVEPGDRDNVEVEHTSFHPLEFGQGEDPLKEIQVSYNEIEIECEGLGFFEQGYQFNPFTHSWSLASDAHPQDVTFDSDRADFDAWLDETLSSSVHQPDQPIEGLSNVSSVTSDTLSSNAMPTTAPDPPCILPHAERRFRCLECAASFVEQRQLR